MNYQYRLSTIYLLLTLLFIYTAASKLLDWDGFVYDLNNQPFPNSLTFVLAVFLICSELAVIGCFFFKCSRVIGLWISMSLMLLFTLYTALVLFNVFDRVPCNCGGVIKNLSWPQHLLFNIFFTLLSTWGIYIERRLKEESRHVSRLQTIS